MKKTQEEKTYEILSEIGAQRSTTIAKECSIREGIGAASALRYLQYMKKRGILEASSNPGDGETTYKVIAPYIKEEKKQPMLPLNDTRRRVVTLNTHEYLAGLSKDIVLMKNTEPINYSLEKIILKANRIGVDGTTITGMEIFEDSKKIKISFHLSEEKWAQTKEELKTTSQEH